VAGVYKEGKAVDRERLPETRVLSMAPAASGPRPPALSAVTAHAHDASLRLQS